MSRPVESSILTLVEMARRRARRMLSLECALLGGAAALLGSCAVLLSGAPATSTGGLAAAALSGAACAATWYSERRKGPLEIARRLDRRLEQDGALLTAFECERRGVRGALAPLLIQRVARALPERAVQRGIPRTSPAFAVAFVLAGACFSWTWERGLAPQERGPELAALERALVLGLSAAGSEEPLDREGEESATVVLAGAAQQLEETKRRSAEPEEFRRALEQIDGELSRLLERTQQEREPPAEWTAARDLARSALAELSRGLRSPRSAAGPRRADPSPTRLLANAAGDSTMVGSKSAASESTLPPDSAAQALRRPDSSGATSPTSPESPKSIVAPEAGTLAGRWWPERYDAVVAGWVEIQRAARTRER